MGLFKLKAGGGARRLKRQSQPKRGLEKRSEERQLEEELRFKSDVISQDSGSKIH